jgi:AraC-like DNA-binding protein
MERKIPTESLLQFYERTGFEIPQDLRQGAHNKGHFNVKACESPARKSPFNRRDYFKICLSNNGVSNASGILVYNDQEIHLNQPCLILTNPSVPSSIEITAGPVYRDHCFFNKQFIEGHIPPDVQYACPLFNPSLYPVIILTQEEKDRLSVYFREMQALQESDYPFKWDMIRNLLQLLIHEGIRLQQKQCSPSGLVQDRLVNSFFTLLSQQFPVDSPENSLKLLMPSHFADLLHVHVNHLNSVVKKHTGKTTRTIIQERIIAEAKALLRNTNWNIAEIAYALGFEYPSHFNKFFKHFTAVAPMEFRVGSVSSPAYHL